MRFLPPPQLTTSTVLSLCKNGIDDAALKLRLESIRTRLESTEAIYGALCKVPGLHQIPRVMSVGSVTRQELEGLYSNEMSATNGSARSAYDQIRNAAPNKKCPLCGVGTVAALDHHLPKSKYPDLSICPLNLVPACHFCNDTKKARFPKTADQQTLHPYFDAHLSAQWIFAKLIQGPPISIVFFVDAPATWTLVDRNRAERHFKICGLGITFLSNANDELSPIKMALDRVFPAGGSSAVQAHLDEAAHSHSSRPNSWQFATYSMLAGDPWFVAGGFQQIL